MIFFHKLFVLSSEFNYPMPSWNNCSDKQVSPKCLDLEVRIKFTVCVEYTKFLLGWNDRKILCKCCSTDKEEIVTVPWRLSILWEHPCSTCGVPACGGRHRNAAWCLRAAYVGLQATYCIPFIPFGLTHSLAGSKRHSHWRWLEFLLIVIHVKKHSRKEASVSPTLAPMGHHISGCNGISTMDLQT